MINFAFDNPAGRVVFGPGAAETLESELSRIGRSRALVVSTARGLASAPPLSPSMVAASFTGSVAQVPGDVADDAATLANSAEADCIVAIGGGSAIGVAKAVALKSGLPIVAVPTTYGGSEMTPIWGITRGGTKETGRDASVRPVTVIYDPDLTLDLPLNITVCSGFNALAHAVEALYAPDANPMSTGAAMQAVFLLTDSLPRLAHSPRDRVSRATALEGAWLAGFALGTVQMGIQHKLAHTLGGSFGLPHAETHAVLLPYTAAFNRAAAEVPLSALAGSLEAGDAPAALRELAEQIGAPLSLAAIGFSESDIPAAVKLAVEKQYPNPRLVTEEGVKELLEAAFRGDSSYVAPSD